MEGLRYLPHISPQPNLAKTQGNDSNNNEGQVFKCTQILSPDKFHGHTISLSAYHNLPKKHQTKNLGSSAEVGLNLALPPTSPMAIFSNDPPTQPGRYAIRLFAKSSTNP